MAENRSGHRRFSITSRLVFGYTLVTLLMLSVAGVILHRGLRRGFELEDGELLSDSVTSVRHEVKQQPGDLSQVREHIAEMAGERQIEKFYGRLVDGSGTILAETRGAQDVMPPNSELPPPAGMDVKAHRVAYARSPNGNPAWIVSALVERRPNEPPLVYYVALDTRHVEVWLDGFRHTLTYLVLGATGIAALLGWGLTRRSLRPLAEITVAAQRVTASGQHEPIGEKPWPRELVSLAEEFDRMLARLRHSFERLSQFTADAAHEFRTPLNNLLGATSLALARPRTAEDYRTLLETNLEEYQRLSHMMERLLFLARADDAQTVLKLQVLDAGVELREVAEFFSALAEESGVALRCEGGGSLTADPALLRMALSNLVSNALRHSPRGAAVMLTVKRDNAGVRIAVRDEGKGIAPEHLPRVFDRFYRADASRATEGGDSGAGLGLALVKTIMELHGGKVTVESHVGRGTEFRLEFPSGAAQSADNIT